MMRIGMDSPLTALKTARKSNRFDTNYIDVFTKVNGRGMKSRKRPSLEPNPRLRSSAKD